MLLLEKMQYVCLGPSARCLLKGEWSIAQLDTRIEFGDGTIGIPYGINVCVSSACASPMAGMNVPEEYIRPYESLLGTMAGLDDGEMDLLALYYGAVISGQPAIHELATDNFADGVVRIELPSFAPALIRMLTIPTGGARAHAPGPGGSGAAGDHGSGSPNKPGPSRGPVVES